jgi:hypothetical protein
MTGKSGPAFSFFLSEKNMEVDEASEIWGAFLPEDRRMSRGRRRRVAYGDYFSAARACVEARLDRVVAPAISRKTGASTRAADIESVAVFLKKHGAFYHPARIEARSRGRVCSFVWNAAFSDAGRARVKEEVRVIQGLNAGSFPGFLPEVFDVGEIPAGDGGCLSFFLGEWFEGHSELHLSRRRDASAGLKVWSETGPCFFLSPKLEWEFYERSAFILTCFYNPETFEQVFPWHHAAGDFIVKPIDGGLDVRLVTARGRGALFGCEDPDPEAVFQGLAFFWINLSIRTRLDRMDGTGETAWAGDRAGPAAWSGFLKALNEKKRRGDMPPSADGFRDYFSSLSRSDIRDMAMAVLGSYNPQAPDIPVIEKNMEAHTRLMADLMGKAF